MPGHIRAAHSSAIVIAAAAVLLGGCSRNPKPGERPPERTPAVSRPLEIYRDLGMKAGPPQFPVVAGYSTVAGPADSTYMMISLSMPNSALRFQRGAEGFHADYSVSLAFLQDSTTVKRFDDRQRVSVATFAETGRTDESVLYQNTIAVPPGQYIVQLQTADINSSRGYRVTDTLHIPAYGANGVRLSSPVVVYSAKGRTTRDAKPVLISNPRNTIAYGSDAPKLYVETYGAPEGEPVKVNVVDESGASIWSADATLQQGDTNMRYGLLDIPGDKLPMGRMWVEVSAGGVTSERTPLVLTISEQWMVANFSEVLEFLRYVAFQDELDSLSAGTPAQRRVAWDAFWARRDPLPTTAVNEFRDLFFERVRYATENFREPGLMGWKTERGEVYIVLGPPDFIGERYVGNNVDQAGLPNAQEWIYQNAPGGRLDLLFIDYGSFGRYQLAQPSQSAFRAAAERLKPKQPR